MAETRVSVVVLNWNGVAFISECLDSLLRSNHPLHEVIVADNGSTDGSVGLIRERYPSVVVVENGANLGAPAGRNVGIRRALAGGAEYVYTIDNDLEADGRTIGALVELMEHEAKIGCAGSIIYDRDRRDLILTAGHDVDWTENLVHPRHAHEPDNGQVEPLAEVDYVGTGAMLTRRAVFQQLGLLDPGFVGYGYEDTDFGMRLNRAGWKVVCCYQSRVWHRPFSGIGRYSFKKKYLESRNAIRFLRRYGKPQHWLKFLLYSVIGLAYAAVVEGARGNIRGVVGKARGIVDGILGREALAYRLLE